MRTELLNLLTSTNAQITFVDIHLQINCDKSKSTVSEHVAMLTQHL